MFRFSDNLKNGTRARLKFDFAKNVDANPRLDADFLIPRLSLSDSLLLFPSLFKIPESDIAELEDFHLEDWVILAYSENAKGEVKNVLIAHLGGLLPAYSVLYPSMEVKFAINEPFAILASGAYYGFEELKRIFDEPSYTPPPSFLKPAARLALVQYGGEESETERIQVDRPSFSPSSKAKPKNLGGYAYSRKEEPDEGGYDVDVNSLKASFSPSSKHKPGVIKDASKPFFKKGKANVDPNSFKQPFVGQSKAAIPNLNSNPNFRKGGTAPTLAKIVPNYDFKVGSTPATERFFALAGPFADLRLRSLIEDSLRYASPKFAQNCFYCPGYPEKGDPIFDLLAHFDIDEWAVLACLGYESGDPFLALICLKGNPDVCLSLLVGGRHSVLGYSRKGMFINGSGYKNSAYYFRLYSDAKANLASKEEGNVKKEEPPKKETEPEKAMESVLPNIGEEEGEEEEIDFGIAEQRRLFQTFRFKDDCKTLLGKHPEAEAELSRISIDLLSLSSPSLKQFLEARHNKQIDGISKFRLKKTAYSAARIFYIHGYDAHHYPALSSRLFLPSDIILLSICFPEDHDRQGEVAKVLSKYLLSAKSVLLERSLLEKGGGKVDSIAYPSYEQFALLRDPSSHPPLAFFGSAGTGKTILSLQNCLDLGGIGDIIYLTYEPSLRDFAAKKLSELGEENVKCLTYAELALDELGPYLVEGENDFHSFFASYISARPKLGKTFAALGSSLPDQASRAYLFYRGVITGCRECADSPSMMLSYEEFAKKMEGEAGLPGQLLRPLYSLALDYRAHLLESGRQTDNSLACMLLGKKRRTLACKALVIDEYQDLTELQFWSLLPYLGEQNAASIPLYIYGDENQCVNPTIFSIPKANAALHDYFHYPIELSERSLDGSYRSGPNLLSFINRLKDLKKKSIGSQRQELETKETTLRSDQDDLFVAYFSFHSHFASIVAMALESDDDIVFVFPSPLSRDNALKGLDEELRPYAESNFLTVSESKGREWDCVVLVDFLSEFGEDFALALQEKAGHSSTVHRMMFNRLYVGLTRAKNRIFLFETNPPRKSEEVVYGGLERIPEGELHSLFCGHVDPDHWMAHGERLLREGDYEGAKRAFERLEGEEGKERARVAGEYCQYERMWGSRKQGQNFESGYIDFLLSRRDYRKLHDVYNRLNLTNKAIFLETALNRHELRDQDILPLFRKIVDKSTFLEKSTFFELAANCLSRRLLGEITMAKMAIEANKKEKGER